jgi:hypothetical protein
LLSKAKRFRAPRDMINFKDEDLFRKSLETF